MLDLFIDRAGVVDEKILKEVLRLALVSLDGWEWMDIALVDLILDRMVVKKVLL